MEVVEDVIEHGHVHDEVKGGLEVMLLGVNVETRDKVPNLSRGIPLG